jgi:hypothetical protein
VSRDSRTNSQRDFASSDNSAKRDERFSGQNFANHRDTFDSRSSEQKSFGSDFNRKPNPGLEGTTNCNEMVTF